MHTHLFYERVDLSIAWKDWVIVYHDDFELHGNFTCSDSCPIILCTFLLPGRRKAFSFQFQNPWSTYQQASNIIRKNWNVKVSGTKMF